MKELVKVIDDAIEDNENAIIAGDLNIDRHLPNNPTSRPDIKVMTMLLEELINRRNLLQMNHKPT